MTDEAHEEARLHQLYLDWRGKIPPMTYEEFKQTGLYKIAKAGNEATRLGVEAAARATPEELRAQMWRNSAQARLRQPRKP